MEVEILLYQQSSRKKKIVIAKKFTREYFKNFIPITKKEAQDRD